LFFFFFLDMARQPINDPAASGLVNADALMGGVIRLALFFKR